MPCEGGRIGIGVGVEGGVSCRGSVGKVVCGEWLAVGLAFQLCRGVEPGRQFLGRRVSFGSECVDGF